MPVVKCNRIRRFDLRASPVLTRSLARRLRNQTTTMTDSTKTLKHEIYTNVISIPKFSGESSNIDLDSYIAIVETYNKGIKDDKQKIEAFKANIHPDKGHARSIIKCRHFVEELNTYQEYLIEFRKHFSRTSDNDPLRIMVKYLGMKRKPGEDTTDYITRLDTFSKQVEDNIRGTPWTEANNDTQIPLRMMSKMLMMAHLIRDSHGSITEKLYTDLNQNIPLSQIDYIIKRYLEKDPQCNQYVLPVRQQSPSSTRQSRARTPSTQKTKSAKSQK